MSNEKIYLIDMGDEIAWCSEPDPSGDVEPDDVTAYIRMDVFNKEAKDNALLREAVDELVTKFSELAGVLDEMDEPELAYSCKYLAKLEVEGKPFAAIEREDGSKVRAFLLAKSDLIERLRGYNPPDRTIDEQRQISVDVHEAADQLEAKDKEIAGFEKTDKFKVVARNIWLEKDNASLREGITKARKALTDLKGNLYQRSVAIKILTKLEVSDE